MHLFFVYRKNIKNSTNKSRPCEGLKIGECKGIFAVQFKPQIKRKSDSVAGEKPRGGGGG